MSRLIRSIRAALRAFAFEWHKKPSGELALFGPTGRKFR